MTLVDFEKKYDDFYTPRFVVKLDGGQYDHADGVISDVVVDAAVEKADRFELSLETSFDQRRGEFTSLDWDRFATGTPVEIAVGYGRATETVLVGRITELSPDFPENGRPSVRVSGYGLQHEMSRGTNSDSWSGTTDAAVVNDIVNNYRFADVEVRPTDTEHPKIVQDGESDLAFVERLAARNSAGDGGAFEVSVRRDAFYFGPAKDAASPALSLGYGRGLVSFSPVYTTGSQVGAVEVRGWDPSTKSEIVGRAERDASWSGTETVRKPVSSAAEADEAAAARLKEIAKGRLEGRGETIGLPEIDPGLVIELTNLGSRFTGHYYVESATHRVSTGGYTTTFEVRLPDEAVIE